ncbi:MAG: BACON domain-containing protein [Bacteroidales bacterium]|nr:BACON domain-containing protein [Bacteroidales bacterium]
MKKLFLYLMLATALFAVPACQKDNTDQTPADNTPTGPTDNYEATITLTTQSVNIGPEEGDTGILIFACDHEWFLEIPEEAQSWLSSEKMSGKSGKTIRVTLAGKANNGPARSATCRILSGSKKKKFTVTQDAAVLILTSEDVPDLDKYYKPKEFNFDMFRSDSKWSWCRSKQSEHFVVFWDIKYGQYGLFGERMGQENTWPTTCKTSSMAVDIDDLLKKAEEFYDLNVNKLKFANTGKGQSVLDKYKMEIYLIYQSEWLATGSGYDNVIGALWVNPSTCKPVGSTIGHEIGHCFQYMTFCDYLVRQGVSVDKAPSTSGLQGPGWRYGFGANGDGGNAFWEQTAQWQSMVMSQYRQETFTGWYGEYTNSTHLHVLHERPRYATYFIHWWWVEQNDITFIGRLWNEAQYPEDPVETYMRMMGYDVEKMNDSMYGYASHMVTYDTEELRKYGTSHAGEMAISAGNISESDGWWNVKASLSPETTGYNAIRMTVPKGEEVSVTFGANLGASGCKSGSVSLAGWRYGFVTLNSDNTRSYSPTWKATVTSAETQTWIVPSNASKLWLVVTGAPNKYERHPWTDETDDKDTKWPWKAQFENTKPYGK